MSDTIQNNEGMSSVDFEWSYSGKAMRAQTLLFVLLSLLAVSGGLYATLAADWLGEHYLEAWCAITGSLVLLWGYHYTVYFYRILTIHYRLTERHLYSHRGLFTKVSDSMELVLIDDAQLTQTLFDRIFNGGVGRIVLYCDADKTSDGKLVLIGIDKPREVFEKINSLRTALRAKRAILTGGG